MFFETKIENRFKGTINGVEFDNQELFYATELVLNALGEAGLQKEEFTEKLIEQLSEDIHAVWMKVDQAVFHEVADELIDCISSANSIEEIKLDYFDYNYFEEVNEMFKKRKFE